MAVQTRLGMPLDEFIREYDKSPFELVDGWMMPLPPRVAMHAVITSALFRLLHSTVDPLAEVWVHSPFVTLDPDGNVSEVFAPSVSVYRSERMTEYRRTNSNWKDKPLSIAPDFAAKIVGREDLYVDVDGTVSGYLERGVRLVWVINPRTRTIMVYTAGSDHLRRLTAQDNLIGGDVLPGFSVPVADLFPKE